MKKILAFLLAAAMLASLVACGGTSSEPSSSSGQDSSTSESESSNVSGAGRFDSLQTTDEPVTLLLDFGNFTPSLNEEPTEEAPMVFRSSVPIVEEWLKDKPNVTIEWSRGKDASSQSAMLEWMNIHLNAGTAPDMLSAWGAVFAPNGWYENLNEVMESPNYYEEGSPVWRDMYPDYMWKDSMHVDANGDVVAVPTAVFPGPPTAYFYNTEIFDEVGITPAKDWDQFMEDMKKVQEAGYIAFDPNATVSIDAGSWDLQFSMRGYAMTNVDQWDDDGDGIMSYMEGTKGLWEGLFYMQTNPGAFEQWEVQKDKYINLVGVGGEAVNYDQDWIDGKLAVKERGIWDFPTENSNTKRTFEFGMMPPPIKNSELTEEIEWTEAGPYVPQPMESFNVLKPEIQDRPAYVMDYVVDFLKFTHTTKNMGIMVEERNGACMGSMKGCPVPASLSEWYEQPFPMNPTANIPTYRTSDGYTKLSKILESWFIDQISEEELKQQWDKALYEDLMAYVEQNSIDVSEWGDAFIPDSAK